MASITDLMERIFTLIANVERLQGDVEKLESYYDQLMNRVRHLEADQKVTKVEAISAAKDQANDTATKLVSSVQSELVKIIIDLSERVKSLEDARLQDNTSGNISNTPQDCPSSDNLGHWSCLKHGGSGPVCV